MGEGQATAALRYDAVVFDVGGTLIGFVDSEPFRQFLVDAGLPAGQEEGRRLYERFLSVIRAERDRAQGVGASDAALEAFWRSVFALVWPGQPDLADEMNRRFRGNRFDRLLPDVRPTLDALHAAGLRLGVVSNFTGGLEALLTQLGVRDDFEFVITSAHVGLAKPDPRIFDLAVRRLGLPRHRLLYVGDHFGDDIQGARAAGLDAVLIDHGFRHKDFPCPRITRLLDLERYVRWPAGPAAAILFDFDGVVLDSVAAHLRAWQETLAPLGIQMTIDDLAPIEGMPTEPMAQLLVEQHLGRSAAPAEIERLAGTKRALYRQYLQPRPIPGIVQLLHDLRGRGYRLGLVTGGVRSVVDSVLALFGIADLLEAVVTSEDTAKGKPDPEPYCAAAARLGLPASDCLVVENAPLGIQSARGAGMACVALETTLPATRLAAADRTFADVEALQTWLLSF
jgi:HAD superfamily hydrolase (TIGR01509 family)